jgi:hypothetical protein
MKTYVFIIKHDQGEVRIKTRASNIDAAKDIICQAESCPRSALDSWFIEVSKKELQRTKEWISTF